MYFSYCSFSSFHPFAVFLSCLLLSCLFSGGQLDGWGAAATSLSSIAHHWSGMPILLCHSLILCPHLVSFLNWLLPKEMRECICNSRSTVISPLHCFYNGSWACYTWLESDKFHSLTDCNLLLKILALHSPLWLSIWHIMCTNIPSFTFESIQFLNYVYITNIYLAATFIQSRYECR